MSESEALKPAAVVDVTVGINKKTLKEVVLEGLEEKGSGKDAWLW
jgi:hypothetical protein